MTAQSQARTASHPVRDRSATSCARATRDRAPDLGDVAVVGGEGGGDGGGGDALCTIAPAQATRHARGLGSSPRSWCARRSARLPDLKPLVASAKARRERAGPGAGCAARRHHAARSIARPPRCRGARRRRARPPRARRGRASSAHRNLRRGRARNHVPQVRRAPPAARKRCTARVRARPARSRSLRPASLSARNVASARHAVRPTKRYRSAPPPPTVSSGGEGGPAGRSDRAGCQTCCAHHELAPVA